jgi:hypothetical protein
MVSEVKTDPVPVSAETTDPSQVIDAALAKLEARLQAAVRMTQEVREAKPGKYLALLGSRRFQAAMLGQMATWGAHFSLHLPPEVTTAISAGLVGIWTIADAIRKTE